MPDGNLGCKNSARPFNTMPGKLLMTSAVRITVPQELDNDGDLWSHIS